MLRGAFAAAAAHRICRFSLREMKKIAYLSRKARKTQERRNRPGDVMLLEGIEDKVQRTLLGF
jgi:hypothetical protein